MMFSLRINTQAAGYTIALAPQVAHLTPILIMILNYSQESGQISRGNRQPTCENPSTSAGYAFQSSLSALGVGQRTGLNAIKQ